MTPRSLAEPARRASLHVLRTQDDERLADLVKTGSHPAFEAIVERYRGPLIRYAAAIVGRDAADEVVQESLVCAHNALMRGDEVACLRAWLHRIVRNKALNLIRDSGPDGLPLDERQAAIETPELVAERRHTLRRVVDAVQALPDKQRDAIVLRELEGRSYDEIAGTLGVSDPAVRGLINRARMTVRRAAAALTPVWPARLAELWSAGAVSSSGAARACATCMVAAVATFGGLPAAVPDEKAKPEIAAAKEPASEPQRATSIPRTEADAVRETAASTSTASSNRSAAQETEQNSATSDASEPTRAEAQTDPSSTQQAAPEPEPIREDAEPRPREDGDGYHRERDGGGGGDYGGGDGDYSRGDYDGYREPRPEYGTAETDGLNYDGLHKDSVGSVDGDGRHRDFHR